MEPAEGVCCCGTPDFWNDRYSEDWPEEYKDWYIRTLAWDVMYNKITGLRALGDALKEEGMHARNMLLLRMVAACLLS